MAYEQMTADMVRRVAELTAELAAVRAQANDDKQELDQVREYAAALNARCISDTADAERYRWLAGNGWAEPAIYATGPRDWGANGVALLAGPQLDDAIDGAMAEQQESALQRLADDSQAMGLTY